MFHLIKVIISIHLCLFTVSLLTAQNNACGCHYDLSQETYGPYLGYNPIGEYPLQEEILSKELIEKMRIKNATFFFQVKANADTSINLNYSIKSIFINSDQGRNYTYDSLTSNLIMTSLTSPPNSVRGRVVAINYYEYDQQGNRIKKVPTSNGDTLSGKEEYYYNAKNQLIKTVSYPSPTVHPDYYKTSTDIYHYDEEGRLVIVDSRPIYEDDLSLSNYINQWVYLGQNLKQPIAGGGRTHEYLPNKEIIKTYNTGDKEGTLELSRQLEYTYDENERITEFKRIGYEYKPFGGERYKKPKIDRHVEMQYSYGANGKIERIVEQHIKRPRTDCPRYYENKIITFHWYSNGLLHSVRQSAEGRSHDCVIRFRYSFYKND
ncbi:MAG: hypothetical protein MK212_00270 [Saprospiraceae bacterium]|nr:hypothetical protein [Saprospiraceae bacterium]